MKFQKMDTTRSVTERFDVAIWIWTKLGSYWVKLRWIFLLPSFLVSNSICHSVIQAAVAQIKFWRALRGLKRQIFDFCWLPPELPHFQLVRAAAAAAARSSYANTRLDAKVHPDSAADSSTSSLSPSRPPALFPLSFELPLTRSCTPLSLSPSFLHSHSHTHARINAAAHTLTVKHTFSHTLISVKHEQTFSLFLSRFLYLSCLFSPLTLSFAWFSCVSLTRSIWSSFPAHTLSHLQVDL